MDRPLLRGGKSVFSPIAARFHPSRTPDSTSAPPRTTPPQTSDGGPGRTRAFGAARHLAVLAKERTQAGGLAHQTPVAANWQAPAGLLDPEGNGEAAAYDVHDSGGLSSPCSGRRTTWSGSAWSAWTSAQPRRWLRPPRSQGISRTIQPRPRLPGGSSRLATPCRSAR